jgi:hypothetical protein
MLIVKMEKYSIEIAEKDLEVEMDYYQVLQYCKELGNNWRLPDKNEFLEIYNQLAINDIGNFDFSKYYWNSNRTHDLESAFARKMENVDNIYISLTEEDNSVRLVRTL